MRPFSSDIAFSVTQGSSSILKIKYKGVILFAILGLSQAAISAVSQSQQVHLGDINIDFLKSEA